jgi:alcohol dehydrogenase class IV
VSFVESEGGELVHSADAACELRMHVGDAREMLLPGRVLHGDGVASGVGDLVSKWTTVGKALVVSDKMLAESGLVDPVVQGLESAGWSVSLFSDIVGEPTVATADAATEAGRSFGADVVIGFGGGSALDVAKVVALLLANDGPVDDHIGADLDENPAKPLILIPTTTGTGAEATRVAVLSAGHLKRVISHRSLVPAVTVLDPTLVTGLPASVTASTGMDALAHAVESTFSTASTPLTAGMGLRAAELMVEWLPRAVSDPEDLRARRATLYGAFLGGVALNAGVVLGHSMAYTVANRKPLPHGTTCAMALPYCIAFNSKAAGADAGSLARVLTRSVSSDLLVAAGHVAELAKRFGLPATPTDAGIAADQEEPMARECAQTYARPANPVPMTEETMLPLYAAWFTGDLAGAAK